LRIHWIGGTETGFGLKSAKTEEEYEFEDFRNSNLWGNFEHLEKDNDHYR